MIAIAPFPRQLDRVASRSLPPRPICAERSAPVPSSRRCRAHVRRRRHPASRHASSRIVLASAATAKERELSLKIAVLRRNPRRQRLAVAIRSAGPRRRETPADQVDFSVSSVNLHAHANRPRPARVRPLPSRPATASDELAAPELRGGGIVELLKTLFGREAQAAKLTISRPVSAARITERSSRSMPHRRRRHSRRPAIRARSAPSSNDARSWR